MPRYGGPNRSAHARVEVWLGYLSAHPRPAIRLPVIGNGVEAVRTHARSAFDSPVGAANGGFAGKPVLSGIFAAIGAADQTEVP